MGTRPAHGRAARPRAVAWGARAGGAAARHPAACVLMGSPGPAARAPGVGAKVAVARRSSLFFPLGSAGRVDASGPLFFFVYSRSNCNRLAFSLSFAGLGVSFLLIISTEWTPSEPEPCQSTLTGQLEAEALGSGQSRVDREYNPWNKTLVHTPTGATTHEQRVRVRFASARRRRGGLDPSIDLWEGFVESARGDARRRARGAPRLRPGSPTGPPSQQLRSFRVLDGRSIDVTRETNHPAACRNGSTTGVCRICQGHFLRTYG